MENQPTKLDKAVKLSIIIGVLIVALSVVYYFIIFSPHNENLKKVNRESEKQEISGCLSSTGKKVEEMHGDREDVNYFFKKCLREKGLTIE